MYAVQFRYLVCMRGEPNTYEAMFLVECDILETCEGFYSENMNKLFTPYLSSPPEVSWNR